MSSTLFAGEIARLVDLYGRCSSHFLHISNLAPAVDEQLLAELFIQAAPVKSVQFIRDRITNHLKYAFVEFGSAEEAEYAAQVMTGVALFGVPLRISRQTANSGSKSVPVLRVKNLSFEFQGEERVRPIFEQFGVVTSISSAGEEGDLLVGYDSYNGADKALVALNGEFIGGREISVSYANAKAKNEALGRFFHGL